MEEIGKKLSEARDTMEVSLEEAAEDLKVKTIDLENIERGNRSFFKDFFELKKLIKDYAKYLGLEYEKFEDEFNEFVFDYTSKIPVQEILSADQNQVVEEKEIISPYTKHKERRIPIITIVIIAFVLIGLVMTTFMFLKSVSETESETNLTYLKGE
ncbi:MAG: helix-turn-helix domain-containing protein [Bacilli bacterium]